MTSSSRTPPLLELRQIGRAFDGGSIVALTGVSLTLDAGESVAVLGASGSGKSCLVNAMTGLDAPDSGEVLWKGTRIDKPRAWRDLRRKEIGVVFQEFNLIPTLSALENVEIAAFGRGLGASDLGRLATEALTQTGLSHRLHHMPSTLSGGERQRVAIARSIINEPSLLVADEPTGSLDSVNARLVANLLFDLCARRGMALILVTHDEPLALRCARRIRLLDGHVEEAASSIAIKAHSTSAGPS